LPQLEALQKKDPLRLNALETEFVKRSGARRRNLRIALSVTVVIVIAGLSVAAIFARREQGVAEREREVAKKAEGEAKKAEGEAKKAQKRALINRLVAEASRPDSAVTQEQALLLSVEAMQRIRDSVDEDFKLRATLAIDNTMRAVRERPAATEKILRVGGTGVVVSGLAWAPTSLGRPRIAGGGGDNSVVLWNAETGAELSRLSLPNGVDTVTWSPNAERLLIRGRWSFQWILVSTEGDVLTLKDSGTVEGGMIRYVEWSLDGKLALIVGSTIASVLNADSNADRMKVMGSVKVNEVYITEGHILPGGKNVLLCGMLGADRRGYAAIHAFASSKPVRVLVNDGPRIEHCAVSPNGEWYATTTIDGVDLWSRANVPPRQLGGGQVGALSFDHKSKYLAAGTTTGTVEIWNVRKDAEGDRAELPGHAAGLMSLQWSVDDKFILTSSADGTAIIWDTENSAKAAVLSGHDKPLTNAAWDPNDPRKRVATSSEDGTVRIFQIGQPEPVIFDRIVDAAYAPSGKHVALAGKDGVVTVRVADTGIKKEFEFGGGKDNKIVTVRYCPNGATLVTRDTKRRVKLWDAGTGALVRVFDGPADLMSTPTCSYDGRFIATYDDDNLRTWNAATGVSTLIPTVAAALQDPIWHSHKLVFTEYSVFDSKVQLMGPDVVKGPVSFEGIQNDGVVVVAWSHDGTRLVSADNVTNGSAQGITAKIHVYDKVLDRAGEGGIKPTLDVPQPNNQFIASLSWSPDDAYLVTGGSDAGRIWDTKSWTTLPITLEVDELDMVAWSPRGDRIATVDKHGFLRLFEPTTGVLISTPTFKGQTVKNTTWSPDGKRLLVLLSDATARLVTVYAEDLQAKLCARAIRNFTRKEWSTYIGDNDDDRYRATCANLPIDPEPAAGALTP